MRALDSAASPPYFASALLCAIALSLGGGSHAAPPPSGVKAAAAAPARPANRPSAVAGSKRCAPDNLHRSACMIDLILRDLTAHYDAVSGGGISSIRALTSTSYSVSLPQEERIDVLTYQFEVAPDGSVKISSKTPSTASP